MHGRGDSSGGKAEKMCQWHFFSEDGERLREPLEQDLNQRPSGYEGSKPWKIEHFWRFLNLIEYHY